jgi:hypothetical protein
MDQYRIPRDVLLSRFPIIAHLPPSLQASIQAASVASFLPQTSTSADDEFATLSTPTIPESEIHKDLIDLTDLSEAIATGSDGRKSPPEHRSPPPPPSLFVVAVASSLGARTQIPLALTEKATSKICSQTSRASTNAKYAWAHRGHQHN